MQVYMGGMAPTSIQNWKKKSCLAIFLAGCDFNCPYCNTPEFLDFKEEYLLDILEVKRQINDYASSVETVLFTGGEPGMQRQALLNLARHCKQIGIDVGIQTNGSRQGSILALLRENILDFVEMDIKAPLDEVVFENVTKSKTFFKGPKEIMEGVKETLTLLKKHEDKVSVFFRTTIVPGMMEKFEDIEKIGEMIKDIKCTWTLAAFNPENTKMSSTKSPSNAEMQLLKEKLQKKFPAVGIEID